MPTYDYRCTACDHQFEEFQSMSAKPLRRCPSCKADALERLIGAGAGLIFKGSGFYETDYRSESYRKAAEKEKPASGEKPAASTTEKKDAGKSSGSDSGSGSSSADGKKSSGGGGSGGSGGAGASKAAANASA
jgi:putative FmdB family regulatory protein